jgi:hypothetical protein
MPAIAAGVTGAFATGNMFAQIYMANQGKDEQRREARRSEALQIKFAQEENARIARQNREALAQRKEEFGRTQGLAEQRFGFDKKQAQFQNVQQVLDRLVGMFDRSSSARSQLSQSFRNRGRR